MGMGLCSFTLISSSPTRCNEGETRIAGAAALGSWNSGHQHGSNTGSTVVRICGEKVDGQIWICEDVQLLCEDG
ncbi:hypothetical protein M0R45_006144 [Rubus argutus]|uniref:Uncharacterized protein n=1 Tax=Rubus argutus TaxID=59490 RepID=A0AAW1YPK1_RUBAR